MSEHLTRDQLVVAATKAALQEHPHIPASMHEYSLIVDVALPVIAKAITDRLRVGHTQTLQCIHLPSYGQVACPCLPLCAGCNFHVPCPTVRLCDEIDTEMGVQR